MMRECKIPEKNKTELQKIREHFKQTRSQFCKVFLMGEISKSTLRLIEIGQSNERPSLLALARAWVEFEKKMKEGKDV